MIRALENNQWILIPHPEHARLAGEFARHWKNDEFAPPDPFAHVLDAVYHHDDSWGPRDANPELTPEGNPSAFSEELVGTYDAFEEIDLEGYLKVRAAATEEAAKRDKFSAIVISMHTVNLLTEQADLSGLSDEAQAIHAAFIDGQRKRQAELKEDLAGDPRLAIYVQDDVFQRAFEFLQACDSFSLYSCARYKLQGKLRHSHSVRSGERSEIVVEPLGNDTYRLSPYPLDVPELRIPLHAKLVDKDAFNDLESFRAAYKSAPDYTINVVATR